MKTKALWVLVAAAVYVCSIVSVVTAERLQMPTLGGSTTPDAKGRPWIISAMDRRIANKVYVDETEIYHSRTDCTAVKGRKLRKESRKLREKYNFTPRYLCEHCSPTAEELASRDLWKIDSTFDKTYSRTMHEFWESHQGLLLADLREFPGLAETMFHFDLQCPLVDRARIHHRIKYNEYKNGDGRAHQNLCPLCRQRYGSQTVSQLYEVDTYAEYRAERGLPPRDRSAEVAALIGAIGNAATAMAGGQPSSTALGAPGRATTGATRTESSAVCSYAVDTSAIHPPTGQANGPTGLDVFVENSGGGVEILVRTQPGCPWQVREFDMTWARLIGPAQGTGTGRFQIGVDPATERMRTSSEWLGRWGAPVQVLGKRSPGDMYFNSVEVPDGSVRVHQCASGITAAECYRRTLADRR